MAKLFSKEGAIFAWIEGVTNHFEKHGIIKGSFYIIVAAFILFCFIKIINIDNIVKSAVEQQTVAIEDAKSEYHADGMTIRSENCDVIYKHLNDLTIKTKCCRSFIVEFHNGTNNSAGLPFRYGEITYEVVAPGCNYVADDYGQILLSRYRFPMYMHGHYLWQGTVENIKKYDGRLGTRMELNGCKYVCVAKITGSHSEIGYLVIEYEEIPVQTFNSRRENLVNEYASKISVLLDREQ